MVSGIFGERTPAMVRAIVEAGHEIVAHSFTQDTIPAQLTAEQVRADIARTTAALEAACGQRPRGWISPRGTPSADSAAFLVEAGYLWQGDVFDDDRPYLQIFDAGRLVAIPLTMEINDLPHAMRFGRSPAQYVELFDQALEHMLERRQRGGDDRRHRARSCLWATDGRLGVRGDRRQGRRDGPRLARDPGRDRGACSAVAG